MGVISVGYVTILIAIPGSASLKEKRSRLRPLLARLQKEFRVSAAEVERMDAWQEAVIACALVSNDPNHTRRVLQKVVDWIEDTWPDVEVVGEQIELI